MTSAPVDPATPGPGPGTRSTTEGTPSVTVQFWAAAKAATGTPAEHHRPGRVADILDEATRAHPRLGAVLQVATVLCDGRVARRDDIVPAGATLEVLPPFAGG